MEKRSITGKDILRMDGLLPPTRRVPVCDAVTGAPDKKKDKKWSFGGILKRISAMRDYDSSSNEEEMVYCKREPCTRAVPLKKASDIVLRPVRKNLEQQSAKSSTPTADTSFPQSTNTNSICRDSIHSRSSDGSLDGIGRKMRKNKLKARAEAKRDRICGESSSEEDLHKSCNSLTKAIHDDTTQVCHKSGTCNRKSRAARTERYIKRLSKDEGHGTVENLSEIDNKRNSLDYVRDIEWSTTADADDLFRPVVYPRRVTGQPNSYTLPAQRSSSEYLRERAVGLSDGHNRPPIDLTKYPMNLYTDLNQNNQYAKPAKVMKKSNPHFNYGVNNDNFNSLISTNQSKDERNYVNIGDSVSGHYSANRSSCPPEPPPRDPRWRVMTHNCNSYPSNGRYQRVMKLGNATDALTNSSNRVLNNQSENLRSYSSNGEMNWYSSLEKYPRRPASLNETSSHHCYLSECTNNRHSSGSKYEDDLISKGTEAMKCQIRNSRNDQLSSNFKSYIIPLNKSTLLTPTETNVHESPSSPRYGNFSGNRGESLERIYINSPTNSASHEFSWNTQNENSNISQTENTNQAESVKINSDEESQQRRRSSKNLEEALSELEAIYNSLRLGDEDLLDRAERRSMEEFSMKQGKNEDVIRVTPPDTPDRSKDDMAYRRMHPKERPTSLSDATGQMALSNISYLMASPILSRKDLSDQYLGTVNYPSRSDEPDITRDDVVYRSIHHANNTLKVVDPQPPFGIPLGPVTTATESDYLHTTPTKPDHPRSLYIPKCEPDVVTDDLAFRALRKDSNTSKNAIESKSSISTDNESTYGIKKKRAIRSQSANLYGLINHERIHLRREPSLQEIADVFPECKTNYLKPFECYDSLRRVVSDGEISDSSTRWRNDKQPKKNTDINGNHSKSDVHRRKLRVYVSPSTKDRGSESDNSTGTEVVRSSPSKGILPSEDLNDEIWQDYLETKSKDAASVTEDTEADFSAYTRLCQDLVNLIKGPDDAEPKSIKAEETRDSILKEAVKINDPEGNSKDDELSILHIQSLGRHYSEADTTRVKDDSIANGENIDKLAESIINSEVDDSKNIGDNTLDFYLRLADENVKIIAEAFSSVADHVRDSRLGQKNSLTSRRSETENDSSTLDTSTRSSLAYSQDEGNSSQYCNLSDCTDRAENVPKENISSTSQEENVINTSNDVDQTIATDIQLDLSRAVHDLQLAAASLCEHEKEIDELEKRMKRNATNSNDIPLVDARDSLRDSNIGYLPIDSDQQEEKERDQEETEISAEIKVPTLEDDEPIEKMGRSTEVEVVPNEIESEDEGENKSCELLHKSYSNEIVHPTGMRTSYVTNIITVILTTYSMVFLACFLALLLATIAAS